MIDLVSIISVHIESYQKYFSFFHTFKKNALRAEQMVNFLHVAISPWNLKGERQKGSEIAPT